MPIQRCQVDGKPGWRFGSQVCYTGPGALAKARKQERAIRASGWVENARRLNPLRADPTRTITLREGLAREFSRRFYRLKGLIRQLVEVEDCFGLRQRRPMVFHKEQDDGCDNDVLASDRDHGSSIAHDMSSVRFIQPQALTVHQQLALHEETGSPGNEGAVHRAGETPAFPIYHQRFAFRTAPQQVEGFQQWLKVQVDAGILDGGQPGNENAYWRSYVEDGYRKGAGRAFDEVGKPYARGYAAEGGQVSDFYRGTRYEFLRSTFAQPIAIEKVQLLAGRVFTDLKNVTEAMGAAMTRTLTDGLVQGKSPIVVARDLNKAVEGIGRVRSRAIARTEVVRAHAEGSLDAMERLGVEEVGVMVEWSAAGDDRTCGLCLELDGVVMKLSEARGLLPRHVNCRCCWTPANVGESTKGQKRGKAAVEKSLDDSIRAEMPKRKKRTLAEQKGRTTWPGADKRIGKRRPISVLDHEKRLAARPVGRRAPVVECGGLVSNDLVVHRSVKCRVLETKAAKAKASHKPSTADKQRHAIANEVKLGKALRAKSLDDNEAIDVILRKGRKEHGIELKTMLDNGSDKITMHPSSRLRKEAWAAAKGNRSVHTVILDDRKVFKGGKYKRQYSGHRIYYKRGVGAFRVGTMVPAKSFAELEALITASDRELAALLKAKGL